jgi:capsular exopolysaccharide synthesis family protein
MDEYQAGSGGTIADNIRASMKANFEQQIWAKDMEIRSQEILVQNLRKRYSEQISNSERRTVKIVDVSFQQDQLRRINGVLDLLQTRVVGLDTERNAPERIQLKKKAVIPTEPKVKNRLPMAAAGGFVFFFVPIMMGIVIERLKPRLYHVSQIRRGIPTVVIGEIMEPPVAWVHGAKFRKRLARYRESVHNWCTHLLLSHPFNQCKTLSVASVAGDDGKTFLAVQIAVAMAQMKSGPVLLIDADMRVGRLHLLFGNEETGIGLADVLSFRNGFGEAVVLNEREPNLHLLSAGQLDVSPYELLGDGRFRELLDTLESHYSLILVVLPPVANAAESLMMAASTDSTLLCVRQGETVLAAMEDVFRKLNNTGSSVDGIVVKDIPYYQMAGKDGGFADKLEQIRLAHLLQYAD